MRKIALLMLIGLWIAPVLAQAECADIVRQALDTTAASCGSTGRNEVCYGNVSLTAEQQVWVTEFDFDEQGDITDVAGVAQLTLSSRVEETGDWGIALMNIQANLPDTLPGQNVMFLLFGDVEITNGVETNAEPVELQIVATSNANIRSQPSTQAPVIGTLAAGDVVTADGRLEDGSWLRLRLEDGVGWMFAELVTVDGDDELLNIYDPSTPVYGPMQAFYFQSGTGDAPCAEAPDSGILIQTPEGSGTVTLSANEVEIQLGSTIYLQAQPGSDMIVNVVEGEARVTAQGTTVVAPAGTRVRIPITVDLRASGAPVGPEPYLDAELAALPVAILGREVVVAPALTEVEIEALVGLVPLPGTWQFNAVSTDCPSWSIGDSQYTLTVQDGGATMTIGDQTYSRTMPGVYVNTFPFAEGGTVTITYTFLSPVSGATVLEHSPQACTSEFNLTRIGD